MSKSLSGKPLKIKKDSEIKKFIKSGGRTGALRDFNKVLKKAVGGTK